MGRQTIDMLLNLKSLIFRLLWVLLLSSSVNGLLCAENWSVKHYCISEGLSNSDVTSIFQDSYGFIWVGTSDGLNRYDGYKFDVYRHNPIDSASIIGNSIQSIIETKNGDIWIGTKNSGIAIWKRKDGSFTNLGIDSEPFKTLKECGIYGMLADEDKVWVKTRNYIFQIDQTLERFESYGHYSSVFKSGTGIAYPITFHNNKLWVGSKDGIHQFEVSKKTFNRVTLGRENQDAEISDLVELNDSCLLLSTLSDITLFNTKNNTIQKVYSNSLWNNGREINCLKSEFDGCWVGTSAGLMHSMAPNQSFKDISLTYDGQEEIKNISAIMIDKSGLMWLGTQTDGLFKVDRKPPKFTSITKNTSDYPLGSYNFKSVFVDLNDDLWLGTQSKGIYCIERKKNSFKHYPIAPIYSNENDPAVLSILKDKDGTFWFGTNKGIYVLYPGKSTLTEFDYTESSEFRNLLTSNQINDIIQDRLGNMWFATQFGLYRFNGKKLTSYFADEDNEASLCNDEINALFEDDEGWIWIGTDDGVNIFDVAEEKFSRIQNTIGEDLVISHNIILSFAQDAEKRVIIGTQSGLSYYDKKTRTSGFWADNNELTTSKVYSLEVDGYNRIWMSSGNGVSYLITDQTFFRFNAKDGVPNVTFNNGASFNNANKELLFAGDKGLTIIKPDSIRLNLIRPEVVITNVQLRQKGKLIENYQGNITDISFKYSRNSLLHVEFAAMEFTNPLYNSYKVFLEGYDDNWRSISNDNYVDFSNLSPGEYTLKITGANSDSVRNNTPTELKITINPPLWMSNYAYIFYFIFGFFIIQTFINYRVRKYRKAYKVLRDSAEDKLKIEKQKEDLSNIHQSLTDSISYAKRIQEAMIPSEKMVKKIFPESFVYYRPKDIVSGDFYWTFERNDKVFVAAVDCTGHGVPGAFMSIIGFDLIKNIIEIQGIECPEMVLNKLNDEVVHTFSNNGYDGNLKRDVNDGMDLALVVYDKKRQEIEFAGAMNPIYIIKDNEIEVHKGDRYPIGFKTDSPELFKKKVISVSKDDIIYLFSDGYADQFGGPEGKKFKYRRFRHLLLNIHKLPIEDQKAILHQKMEEWMGSEHEQVDDMLLIGLKF
ncbi:ligand-binding sensor domain-containing protein [Carboxylicivirga caseinilyticus]|uniref:ligand-binding sensor domain-containing protein n=1 Tax=Carboxylicivirga caseinilyticus TaxID=3417572 RepID=UPI003D3410A5|nr:SpoIIE family protein phosphatase [Marinilabiliaceae bacterium A049]